MCRALPQNVACSIAVQVVARHRWLGIVPEQRVRAARCGGPCFGPRVAGITGCRRASTVLNSGRPPTLRPPGGECPAAVVSLERRDDVLGGARPRSRASRESWRPAGRADVRRFITGRDHDIELRYVASCRVEVLRRVLALFCGRRLRSLEVAPVRRRRRRTGAAPRHRKPPKRLCQHSAAVTPAP